MTARDWRAGELRFLLLALVVAVASLSSVGFFVDRMHAGLKRDANQLLGADLVISADQPVSPNWLNEARRRQLQLAQTIIFPSMAIAGEGEAAHSQLASVKAVSPGYPLRGHLTLAQPGNAQAIPTKAIPSLGKVWIDAAIAGALHLQVGQTLQLGDKAFTVEHVITAEPDRGAAFINFAPRVMLATQDLPATNLVQAGSRVTYRLLVAGATADVTAFQAWVAAAIERDNLRGVRIESLESGRPEMRNALARAERFLSLVGLLSAMLAAVAIAMAARRFMVRHVDACAMLRCLGATQQQVTLLYLLEFLLIGVIGSVIGALVGFATHFVLLDFLGQLITTTLPPVTLLPGLQAMVTGLVLLVGFAIPPILQLRDVPHNRVLRREREVPKAATLMTYFLGLVSFTALLLWQAGNLRLGLLTAGGFLGGLIAFTLISWLSLRLLRRGRSMIDHPSWRFALTGLQRRPEATIVQIVALSLGLMALLMLTIVRGELIEGWQASTPSNAPNQFVINIQPDQKAPITAQLRTAGIDDTPLFPMIRGRLIQVNQNPINATTYADDRAKGLVEREFNLSTMTTLPVQNEIVAGRWFNDTGPEASVEQGLAKTLGLKLGDQLVFDIGGQQVSAPITSLRKLDWGSMRVNFFVILNPKLMANVPQTWITAFHLPPSNQTFVSALTQSFPNLTVLDVGNVLRQIQSVLNQVVSAVEFLFLFTLAAGGLVLYAALLGSQHERTREAGLLRALGATRSQLASAQWIEYSLIGGLSGLLAATGAAVAGWALAHFVFELDWSFRPWVWIAGVAVGAACSLFGGWLGLRNVLNQPPLQTLREA
jgi:putative ABC transport system permease protein